MAGPPFPDDCFKFFFFSITVPLDCWLFFWMLFFLFLFFSTKRRPRCRFLALDLDPCRGLFLPTVNTPYFWPGSQGSVIFFFFCAGSFLISLPSPWRPWAPLYPTTGVFFYLLRHFLFFCMRELDGNCLFTCFSQPPEMVGFPFPSCERVPFFLAPRLHFLLFSVLLIFSVLETRLGAKGVWPWVFFFFNSFPLFDDPPRHL